MKTMRKTVSMLLLCAVLAALFPLSARAAGPNGSLVVGIHNEAAGRYETDTAELVNLMLDGKGLDLTGGVPALVQTVGGDGRTLVPLRFVSERLGATVMWVAQNRQVILRKASDTIVLTLGSAKAVVNGREVDLPGGVPATVVSLDGNESTMVPLRFVSEQLGAAVDWVQESYTAKIVRPVSTLTYITRVTADSDRQTVLIATDRTPEYRVTEYEGKAIVDLLGAELSAGFPGTISVDNDLITTVRYAQHEDDLYPEYAKTVRVVLDLKEGITFAKNVKVESREDGVLLTTFLTEEDRKEDAPFVPSTPLDPAKKTIVVDAGHGGSRSGAVYEGIQEKDINLAVSLYLETELKNRGYNVVMTRSDDVYMDLYDRADVANDINADLFVSIHSNAFDNPEIHGLITYYHPSSSRGKRLAQAIQGPASAATGAADKGVASADFVVLRETSMCAVLVEMGFMTNHDELMNLNNSAYQQKMAQGIAEGVVRYLNGQ